MILLIKMYYNQYYEYTTEVIMALTNPINIRAIQDKTHRLNIRQTYMGIHLATGSNRSAFLFL